MQMKYFMFKSNKAAFSEGNFFCKGGGWGRRW